MSDVDDVVIRNLGNDDYPTLIEVMRRHWYADAADTIEHTRLLAEADFEYCLARSDMAMVAVMNGETVGVILGSLRSDAHHGSDAHRNTADGRRSVAVRSGTNAADARGNAVAGAAPRAYKRSRGIANRHYRRAVAALLSLMPSQDGRRGVAEMIRIGRTDSQLVRDAGRDYPAEVALFIVDSRARGRGVGRRLFGSMMAAFKARGVDEYFLFTDTSCDVGFYDHQGLRRRVSRRLRTHSGDAEYYLYEGDVA